MPENSRTTAGQPNIRAISLDQLVALNDEIAALVRAGVPLEQGLVEFGLEMPGRLGEIALRLGQRIQAGESLDRILVSDESTFSPIWRAVVAAGLRSGNLPAALEGLSTTGRRVAEMRQAFRAALVYPMVVVALSFACFMLLVTHLAPALASAQRDLTSTTEPMLEGLVQLGESAKWWGPAVPIVGVVVFAAWLRRSRRITWNADGQRRGRTGFCWPTIGQVLGDGQMATLAEVLALLVRQQVPLHESLVLAGAASGDRDLRRAADAMAERLTRGESLSSEDARALRFPPLLGWLITTGRQESNLAQQLSWTAERYRLRAARSVTYSRIVLPLLATAVVGGSVTFLHGVIVFGSLGRMLYSLATF